MKLTNNFMKRLSLYLFFILFTLQAPSWADDIRDFQIEGMSIGDSALDYYSEEKIKKNISIPGKKFNVSGFNLDSGTYNRITISYKTDDKKYEIHSISAHIIFGDNIKACYKKQNKIANELSELFKNLTKEDWGVLEAGNPTDPEATYRPITYDFKKEKNAPRIQIACYDFFIVSGYDSLRVLVYSGEYRKHISQVAKKK